MSTVCTVNVAEFSDRFSVPEAILMAATPGFGSADLKRAGCEGDAVAERILRRAFAFGRRLATAVDRATAEEFRALERKAAPWLENRALRTN